MWEQFKGIFKGKEKIEEPKKEGQKEGQEDMEMKSDSNYETAKKIEKEWEQRRKDDPNAWREQK